MGDTSKKTPNVGPSTDLVPIDELFELLKSPRRRELCHYLEHTVGDVTLGEAAEHLALIEGDPSRERYERVLVSLHHVHLPKLVNAGVVRYDQATETITRLNAAEQMSPYLKQVRRDEANAAGTDRS